MNILLIDNDKELENIFGHISSTHIFEVALCHDIDTLNKEYQPEKFDIVIIDFTLDFANKALNTILNKNPKQRVITISGALQCSEPKGGEYCKKHYNKVRLFKPLNIHNLINCLKNFDNYQCKFRDKFHTPEGIIDIMDRIVQRYPYITYEKSNRLINIERVDSDYLDFIDILSSKNIKYELIDEKTIKIF